mgnify:CR=1 FL=1
MNKRVFKAHNIQEAMANIKQELGADAMILSTRKVKAPVRDPYARDMVEIEAAPSSSKTGGGKPHGTQSWEPPFPAAGKSKPALPIDGSDTPAPEGSLMSVIQEELAGIKDAISIAGLSGSMNHLVNNHLESARILASLLRAGVSEKIAHAYIRKACYDRDEDLKKHTDGQPLKNYVMKACADRIKTRNLFHMDDTQSTPHVAAFVGPTGVGKTTTIAKLAARMTYERQMNVGLISIDNYRIGAFEQLKAYGSIMGLACVQAFCARELSRALDNMKAMDVILVDTAGHSHYDEEKIAEDALILAHDFGISIHLVLSVTAESINMKEAAVAYSKLKPDSYVFTKIDETKRCGKILDQISDLNLPVSLITNGQRVPEDLLVPDRRTLMKVMLGQGQGGEA